jgi:hypothetical protein
MAKSPNLCDERNKKCFIKLTAKTNKLYFCFLISFFVFSLSSSIYAQQPDVSEIAPPPLKILSKVEKKQLEETPDIKKRTILALDLMEARLKRIEELDNQNEFVKMYEELGGFHALLDYTLDFLYRNNTNRKNLSNLKRYEMRLRAFPPRIEIIRRELPIKYESYLRDLLKIIREARTKAVEPFFGDTVVPNSNS